MAKDDISRAVLETEGIRRDDRRQMQASTVVNGD